MFGLMPFGEHRLAYVDDHTTNPRQRAAANHHIWSYFSDKIFWFWWNILL